MNNSCAASIALCLLFGAASARAEEETTFDVTTAVKQTLSTNPSLRAALADVQQSRELVRAEEARYRPTLQMDATSTWLVSPSLSLAGGTTRSETQSLVLGADLKQTFAWGTSLDLRVETSRSTSQEPTDTAGGVASLGPGYGLVARLSLTQPLLRGFGTEVGEAQLRAAILSRRGLERARDVGASQSLSSVLQAYWELWYAQKALAIEEAARELAQRQYDEAARRLAVGALAEVDLLSFKTRLAELEQTVLAARLTARKRSIELHRAMGQTGAAPGLELSLSEPAQSEPADSAKVLAAAQEASYSVQQQQVEVERAVDTLRTAAESTRSRLDVVAYLQAEGLGNQEVSPAFNQLANFANVSANVGLVFELPLSGQRHDAQQAAAQIAVTAARERLTAAIQGTIADTATELAALAQAQEALQMAKRTTELASRSVDAQRKRFESGTAIALEVREAEDTLRRAQLSIERARVDAANAQVRLAHLTGDLLVTWGAKIGD